VVFAVFNDSSAALNAFMPRLDAITGAVTELQSREVMANLAVLNLHLKARPIFETECNVVTETCRILSELPEHWEMNQINDQVRGRMLERTRPVKAAVRLRS
jgi:hypothetical protein